MVIVLGEAVVLVSLGAIEWTLEAHGVGDRAPRKRALVRLLAAAAVLALSALPLPGARPGSWARSRCAWWGRSTTAGSCA